MFCDVVFVVGGKDIKVSIDDRDLMSEIFYNLCLIDVDFNIKF